MKRILITGGLGYVGGRIAHYLSKQGDVYVVVATRKTNIVKPDWFENGEIKTCDVLDKGLLFDVCSGIDSVIHLSAVNEIESIQNPAKALQVNTQGTLNVLEAAEQQGVEKFIYFSTAHIYKSPLEGMIDENTLPRPVDPYAITHKAAEDFVLSYNDGKNITGVVLRLSNGFGAPVDPVVDRWTLLVNDLCRQAVKTKKLILRSAGLQKRDFIALTDVCCAVKHFLTIDNSRLGNCIFNLGGEFSCSIIEMTERIGKRCQEALGFAPEIIKPDVSDLDIESSLKYSIEKLKSTGFSLKSPIDREIDNTLLLCQKAF